MSPATKITLNAFFLVDKVNGRTTYDNRARYQIFDCAAYFFSRLDVISKADYVPNDLDIFHTRVRTTGIVETEVCTPLCSSLMRFLTPDYHGIVFGEPFDIQVV